MDMHPRNEYLKAVRERYFKAKTKEKSQILDEYCEHQATKTLRCQEDTQRGIDGSGDGLRALYGGHGYRAAISQI